MIYINGVHPADALQVARAIVVALRLSERCAKPKEDCPGELNCFDCAVINHITFIHDERRLVNNEHKKRG